MIGVEDEIAADTLRDVWFHCNDLETNLAVAAGLAGSLAAVKAEWRAARDSGDLAAEQAAAAEWQRITLLMAAAHEGLRDQLRRMAVYGMPEMIVLCIERP